MIRLCNCCIEEVKSRAEKVFVGAYVDFDEDEEIKCEWCEEESDELRECEFYY